MKNKSIGIIAIILITQIIVMAIVYYFVDFSVTGSMKENAVKTMETVSQERSQIIENYIVDTENYLTAYSRAGEIKALLKNPSDEDIVREAQEYTERFSEDREYLEGIYTSNWETNVLAHTNPKVVGITTREGEALTALQKLLLDSEKVYNNARQYSVSADQLRHDIMDLNQSSDVLSNSLQQITTSVSSVKEVTRENSTAIGMIGQKNGNTSQIADKIRLQSDDNRKLILQLEKLIKRFKFFTS